MAMAEQSVLDETTLALLSSSVASASSDKLAELRRRVAEQLKLLDEVQKRCALERHKLPKHAKMHSGPLLIKVFIRLLLVSALVYHSFNHFFFFFFFFFFLVFFFFFFFFFSTFVAKRLVGRVIGCGRRRTRLLPPKFRRALPTRWRRRWCEEKVSDFKVWCLFLEGFCLLNAVVFSGTQGHGWSSGHFGEGWSSDAGAVEQRARVFHRFGNVAAIVCKALD
jgi:hypothetical protein